MIRKNPHIHLLQTYSSTFIRDVARTNNQWVRGYKIIQNEF